MQKLKDGAKVADVGCGVGFSTFLMAEAFPSSSFICATPRPVSARPTRSARAKRPPGSRRPPLVLSTA